MFINIDYFRNFYIGNNVLTPPFVIEIIGTTVSIVFIWLLTYQLDMGLAGALINVNLFNFVTLSNYVLYFRFGPDFKDYRQKAYEKETNLPLKNTAREVGNQGENQKLTTKDDVEQKLANDNSPNPDVSLSIRVMLRLA